MFQDIKNILSLAVILFFFLVILVLFCVQVPPENLDLLKILLMSLLSGASMILGYYFGSSDGSARKTELLTPPPQIIGNYPISSVAMVSDSRNQSLDDSGFVRIPVILSLVIIASLLMLAGCATTQTGNPQTDSPAQVAGKSLLTVKASILTAATTVDGLCNRKQLTPDKCLQAKQIYESSKPAYDTTVDAYMLMSSQGGDPAAFRAALIRLQDFADRLVLISGGVQ